MKHYKKIITLILSFILLTTFSSALALDLYKNEAPTDTDLDGLTDQGEIQIFFTSPTNPDTDNDSFLDGTEILVDTDHINADDPLLTGPTTNTNTELPWKWYIARASGIISYLLLFLLMMTGIGLTTGYIYSIFGPIIAWRIHRTISISLVAFILIHILTLLFDEFIGFSVADILIPFYSDYSPIYLSLGIIGFYLFTIITLTSIFLIVKKYKFWRFLHYLTFPTFIMLFIHGVFIGTDTNLLPMQIMYWSTGIITGLAFLYRLFKPQA